MENLLQLLKVYNNVERKSNHSGLETQLPSGGKKPQA
jgi:hypothetical protein